MGEIIEDIFKTSTKAFLGKFTLEEIFLLCQNQGFACAMYRLPNPLINEEAKNTKHLIIDLSAGRNLDHLHLEEMGCGFIFHPFSSEHHQIKFINCDIHITENGETKQLDLIHSKTTFEEIIELFDPDKNKKSVAKNVHIKTGEVNDQKNEFISLIEKTIHEIKNDVFQKVVITRNKTIELPGQFSSTEFFESIIDHYKNAFVYMTFIPEVGTWIGATPETLININNKRQFQTVALAATQAYNDDIDLEDTTW